MKELRNELKIFQISLPSGFQVEEKDFDSEFNQAFIEADFEYTVHIRNFAKFCDFHESKCMHILARYKIDRKNRLLLHSETRKIPPPIANCTRISSPTIKLSSSISQSKIASEKDISQHLTDNVTPPCKAKSVKIRKLPLTSKNYGNVTNS